MRKGGERGSVRNRDGAGGLGPLFDRLQAGYFRVDLDGRFVEVNEGWLRMHGYTSRAEVLGKHVSVTQVETDRPAADAYVAAMKEGRPIPTGEFARRRKDGTIGYQTFSANPVMEQGRVTGFEGFMIDITERKRLEILYRNTVDAMPVGMHFYRLEPGGVLRYLGANPAGDRILGIDTSGRVGQSIEEAFPYHAHTDVPDCYRRVAATGERWERDEVVYEDGTIDGVFHVVAFQTEPSHMVAMFMDITAHKRAEATLRRSRDELERLVQERTARLRELAAQLTRAEHRERRRLAEVLHEDLQQRLVAIRYRISALAVEHGGTLSATDAGELQEALVAAIELSRDLTTQMRPPVLYELGLEKAIAWLAGHMQSQFGLTVRVEGGGTFLDAPEDTRIFAFEAARELLMNVVKHAGVKEAQLRLWRPAQGQLALAVRDRGRGFEVFRDHHHEAFGLFSLRERTEAYGGRMRVFARPGKGTRVQLLLPTTGAATDG